MKSSIRKNYDQIIAVGDLHIRRGDVAESCRFVRWLIEQSRSAGNPLLMFMGDQFNDFGIVRVEVLEFWKWAFDQFIGAGVETASLDGNHDMNQEESASAMSVFDERTTLVQKEPIFINRSVAAVGFIRDESAFHRCSMTAYQKGARTVLCHAEFEGSQYESGTYSPNGFKLDAFPKDLSFITGHIHKQQSFGNVWCIGTPRHITRSDIGEIKGVNFIDFRSGTTNFVQTPSEVYEPFREVKLEEATFSESVLDSIPNSPRMYAEVVGSKEFVKKVSKLLPPLVKIRSSYTDSCVRSDVRESDGIPKSFSKFSDDFFKRNGTSEEVRKKVLEKVMARCPSLRIGAQV